MFETSVVQARVQPAGGRFSLLTMSIIAHSAVVIGAIAVSIASIEFPSMAPKETGRAPVLAQVRVPPPFGTQHERRAEVTPPKAPATPARPANEITAPQQIPDNVPEPGASGPVSGDQTGPATGDEEPIGVPWGVKDSVGDLDAPPASPGPQPVENRIYEAYEVKAPVQIYRVDPPYPQLMLQHAIPATVVVRCIIDKNGRVRDAQVVVSALPPFNQAVINAVKQWRFTPGSLRGEAVETYLNLTVHFTATR